MPFQLDVKKAMRMNETHLEHHNAGLSMAHDPILGIVTADSLRMANQPDKSSIADNPVVAGSAGASDPTIAAVVRGIRERALPLASADRSQKTSGQTDASKFNPDDPGMTFVSGMAARAMRSNKKKA